ncbi:hypothetical protein [Pararhizobium qamdonense]|uniref:hypothetical protein n=1 Tax=Pararhizobium qamdonense TaxID=3031126 RepID=UPI0023E1EA3E|nr:hypothetical protein [Pararhizobium qamdonense]
MTQTMEPVHPGDLEDLLKSAFAAGLDKSQSQLDGEDLKRWNQYRKRPAPLSVHQRVEFALMSPAPSDHVLGWTKVPEEPTLEFLKSINRDKQVLAYENGRYYNAWFEFEQSEGGWLWMDDADSEPNPSHYRSLGPIGIAASETPK